MVRVSEIVIIFRIMLVGDFMTGVESTMRMMVLMMRLIRMRGGMTME